MENLQLKASDDYRHISKILRNQTNFGDPTKIQDHKVSVGTSLEHPSETSRAMTEADVDMFLMSVSALAAMRLARNSNRKHQSCSFILTMTLMYHVL